MGEEGAPVWEVWNPDMEEAYGPSWNTWWCWYFMPEAWNRARALGLRNPRVHHGELRYDGDSHTPVEVRLLLWGDTPAGMAWVMAHITVGHIMEYWADYTLSSERV